jgi:hypothetical protein
VLNISSSGSGSLCPHYENIGTSQVLEGLSIELLEQTLEKLSSETNTAAAHWLMQHLQTNA